MSLPERSFAQGKGWVGLCCWAFEDVTGWGVLLLWVLVAEQPLFPEPISLITPH
jgi:uncharacterized RDD family membrane protein YckC